MAVSLRQDIQDLLAVSNGVLPSTVMVFPNTSTCSSHRPLLNSSMCLVLHLLLCTQAIESRGLYSDSVPEVKGFYQSYSYIDDLAWAAAWLAMRTQDPEDIKSAQFYTQQHLSEEAGGDRRRYDYNNMLQGVSYLLAKLDPAKKEQWSRPIRETMTTWLRGQDNITYTEQVRDSVRGHHVSHMQGA